VACCLRRVKFVTEEIFNLLNFNSDAKAEINIEKAEFDVNGNADGN
jgi:hypothetical protein